MKNGTKDTALRKLTLSALLCALSVVIGIICKNFFTWNVYYRVTFENFPIILTGFCFGPFWGAAAGAAADVLSCLCSTNPAVNPVITAGAVTVGLLSGAVPMLFKKLFPLSKISLRLALAVAAAHLFGQVLIKSIGKILFFGMPPEGILIGLGFSAVIGTAEYFFILFLLRNRSIASSLDSICPDIVRGLAKEGRKE